MLFLFWLFKTLKDVKLFSVHGHGQSSNRKWAVFNSTGCSLQISHQNYKTLKSSSAFVAVSCDWKRWEVKRQKWKNMYFVGVT